MQSRLREFDNSYKLGHIKPSVKTFPIKEQRFFIRDCIAFIKQNEHAEQLQEKVDEWIADRIRRYGMPLNEVELHDFEEHVAGLYYPRLTLSLKK
ncbi:hypothetical protein Mpsy_3129 [Methanolobus psychrophilus R15]|nr:hypothetical protein Mpsy_3129 [Methanolobus psychrophilus R15]